MAMIIDDIVREIDNLEKMLLSTGKAVPEAPTEEGSYSLIATVSGGSVDYSWGEGSGGNPNTVTSLTGNMSNIFGDMSSTDFSALLTDISNKAATAYFTMDLTELGGDPIDGFLIPSESDAGSIEFRYGLAETVDGSSTTNAYIATWAYDTDSVVLTTLVRGVNDSVSDYSSYASSVAASLTIVRHPLPDGE